MPNTANPVGGVRVGGPIGDPIVMTRAGPAHLRKSNYQATVYNPIHENFIESHRQIPGLEAVRPAQSFALLSRLRDVLLHDRRAVRPRRHGYDLRPRDNADVSSRLSIFLVHS